MLFARAVQSTAVMVLVTAATIVSAATAKADVDLAEQYAQQAQAAADAADQAFVDADWDEVSAQAGAFEAAYAKLLAHRSQLATDLSDRQSAVTSAQLALDEAQIELDFALGSVATAQGSLTQAIAARDEALAALDRARAAVEAALLALVGVPRTIQQCMEDGSGGQRCIELPNVRYQELMGAAEDAQTVADSAANHVTSRQAAVNDELDKLRTQMAQYNVDFWEVAVAEARAALDDARAAVGNAEDLVDQADGLIDGLEDAVQSVADRRADLVDLDTVKRTVVWTLGVDNETPRAGDTVTLNFAIPNSQLFALSSAQVTVTTPLGVVPTCDIVDGVVAAGAMVHCSATYVPTDADAAAGQVTFEVELTGYIPLGPGNPRAKAATQTRIAASTSIMVPVAAGDEDAGSDDYAADDDSADGDDDAEIAETAELAETGLGSAGAAGIAVALMLGGALLIVGRERTLPRP